MPLPPITVYSILPSFVLLMLGDTARVEVIGDEVLCPVLLLESSEAGESSPLSTSIALSTDG